MESVNPPIFCFPRKRQEDLFLYRVMLVANGCGIVTSHSSKYHTLSNHFLYLCTVYWNATGPARPQKGLALLRLLGFS